MAMIAYKCHDVEVMVVDISERQIEAWKSDELPIYEPGLEEIVKERRGKNLFFSTDVEGEIQKADIIFVSVNTPTKTSGVGAGEFLSCFYFGTEQSLTFVKMIQVVLQTLAIARLLLEQLRKSQISRKLW